MPEALPHLDQLNVVGDMERSLAFYHQLGVDVPSVWRGTNGQQHASAANTAIDLDFDSPAFAAVWDAGWAGRSDLAGRVVVGFKVGDRDEVDRLFSILTSDGHKALQQPYDAFWGARYAIVEDPDGFAVGLMSAIEEAFRIAPPA